jgi:peptidoglycan/xylan/chitin deacetylase (PgdA/CDA1 family)
MSEQEAVFPESFISLSFDDGWKVTYENASPLFRECGVKTSHYIISGTLDDEQFPRYMNLDQVRQLEKEGHEIGCHTVSHKHLLDESQSIIEEEIFLSLKYLRNQGLHIETFAYPYGQYDDRVLDVAEKAEFKGARSTIPGFNDKRTDPFLLKCQAVKVDTKLAEIVEWIDHARTHKVWLILMFHQIDHEGRAWSTTPEVLKEILDYIKESKLKVVTVRDGLELQRELGN